LYRNSGRGKRGKTKSTTNDTLIAVVENVNATMLAELNDELTLEDIIGQDVDVQLCFWPNGFASIKWTVALNTRHINRSSTTLWRQQLLCWSRRIARATMSLCRREITDSGGKLTETITREVCRVKYGHG